MTELILAVYAVVCVVATVGFIGFGLASRQNTKSSIHQTIEEFEQAITDSCSDSDLQGADFITHAPGRSEPLPRRVNSRFSTRSRATSAM